MELVYVSAVFLICFWFGVLQKTCLCISWLCRLICMWVLWSTTSSQIRSGYSGISGTLRCNSDYISSPDQYPSWWYSRILQTITFVVLMWDTRHSQIDYSLNPSTPFTELYYWTIVLCGRRHTDKGSTATSSSLLWWPAVTVNGSHDPRQSH